MSVFIILIDDWTCDFTAPLFRLLSSKEEIIKEVVYTQSEQLDYPML